MRAEIILALLIIAILAFELVALTGSFATITAIESQLPYWAHLVVIVGLCVLAFHFIRARQRRQRASR